MRNSFFRVFGQIWSKTSEKPRGACSGFLSVYTYTANIDMRCRYGMKLRMQ